MAALQSGKITLSRAKKKMTLELTFFLQKIIYGLKLICINYNMYSFIYLLLIILQNLKINTAKTEFFTIFSPGALYFDKIDQGGVTP